MDSVTSLLQGASLPAYYGTVTLGLIVGSLAIISPRLFGKACKTANYWVTTPMQIEAVDKKIIDTDSFVLQHIRPVGVGILALSLALMVVAANAG